MSDVAEKIAEKIRQKAKTSKEIAIFIHDAVGFIHPCFGVKKEDVPKRIVDLENEKWIPEKAVLAAVAELEQAYEASCQAYEMVEKERDNAELRLSEIRKHFGTLNIDTKLLEEAIKDYPFLNEWLFGDWLEWLAKLKKLLDGGEQQ